jgi:hypothetical protein
MGGDRQDRRIRGEKEILQQTEMEPMARHELQKGEGGGGGGGGDDRGEGGGER